MLNEFKNKIIVVTGGAGSIGSALVKHLLNKKPAQIRILSINENEQYLLQEKLDYPKNLRLLIGDIRDKERLNLAFRGADIIFHAAALKHVPLCEYNPFEAVKTNILGSQNVIESALKNKIKKVIAISTDKAVNPVNIMGTTKLMMEKLFINANYCAGATQTKFSCVRFGNVAWTQGSVLPLWKKQAEKEKTIKLTNKKMTRFLMSQNQAIGLILKATELCCGGEIFIFKMPSIKLDDLSKMFLTKYFPQKKIKIKIINQRAGEKKHEELLNAKSEYQRFVENREMFIAVPKMRIFGLTQAVKNYHGFKKAIVKNYSSENFINLTKIKKII